MTLKNFNFKVLKKDSYSRLGKISTHRGVIDTPVFMPVGTQATIKGSFIRDIIYAGSQIILSNTYHLMIRPGEDRIKSIGGIHKFMNKKKGAIFNSHIDGKRFILSPENSIKIQKKLNSDIVMVLDECPKKTMNYDKIFNAVELSTSWAKRSKKAFGVNKHKALFGIVQGGLYKDLRLKSLEDLIKIGFDGYAIGGLAVGDTQSEMFDILEYLKDYLPPEKPRYLMGVGTPSDILGAVKNGIDMFDCVLPTRAGRTGLAFTWNGRINIRNSKYKNDHSPLDLSVKKFDLNKYSKSYLNHLFNTNEMLGPMLLTLNNINFYQELMLEIRRNIQKGTFIKFFNKYINKL